MSDRCKRNSSDLTVMFARAAPSADGYAENGYTITVLLFPNLRPSFRQWYR